MTRSACIKLVRLPPLPLIKKMYHKLDMIYLNNRDIEKKYINIGLEKQSKREMDKQNIWLNGIMGVWLEMCWVFR